ncbi:NAD(P)-binding domain-containing protein [Amycolatopsis mongoliensis]|uniref:NAD(P)-binding domain-containing protein n=1 Tax=Amycolatopsis mongoliensis TaxID=715475 RepID=A0A9Y2JTX6_9PSEU|nr:NAD(P)-binding domain-containing protein [Amycolatopsis sp. 4-36]WIY03591.1 NAD(P)-binding domain-containing protein [Amycolatopsis sp. 4-36]
MRIGIFGTGAMATALGPHWANAGHELRVAGRDPARAAALGARTGTWAEVAAFADVLLLAVPADAVFDVLAAAGPLPGKVLVDCTNQPGPDGGPPPGTPVAARIAAAAPDAHVVKAFNLAPADVWRKPPRTLTVPLCGDDPAALDAVRTLVRDIGCTAVLGGGLDRAHLLEATAAFAIGLWFAGEDARAILVPVG